MNIKNMLFILSICTLWMSFSACTIEGEKICGIWYAQGDYGQMKIEITPWEGKFHGYLLEYNDGKTTNKGAKEEDYIMLTDLVFEKEVYKNGKIYFGTKQEESCDIVLKFINDTELKASYICQGQSFEEVWTKEGFKTTASSNSDTTTTTNSNSPTKKASTSTPVSKPVPPKSDKTKTSSPATDVAENTIKKSTFYIIGQHKTVAYDDMNEMAKVVEALWADIYDKDFSTKLSNITDQQSMYLTYSHYDQPKGKMTITLGYKVKDLSNVPTGLKGITIPSNPYYQFPLSGKASDYEGEGWSQLAELMAYRKANSVDFEVYTFDNNYEVTTAAMWIAAQ